MLKYNTEVRHHKMTAQPETFTVGELENAVDSIETTCFFLDRDEPLRWKWVAFAIHHSIYSMCITCLGMFQPSCVLSSRKGKDKDDDGHLCQIGNRPLMKSKRVPVATGPAYRIVWEPTNEPIPENNDSPEDPVERLRRQENLPLIGFWTALARVQDPILWMGRLGNSKALVMSDEEIRQLTWLHQRVRNELMHFKPKSYTVFIDGVRTATLTAVRAVQFLALESHTFVWPENGNHYERIQRAVKRMRERLNGEQPVQPSGCSASGSTTAG